MRAMILAAGRGERMQQLTAHTPKALLRVHGCYLIEYSIRALAKIGVQEIVINVCYKAEMIKSALGTGAKYGVTIVYSDELEALETGGGIFQALPLLGSDPFIVISCDLITSYPLQNLPKNIIILIFILKVIFVCEKIECV
jgi:MurNAc alpha-1-phosphate uridylyltransferase